MSGLNMNALGNDILDRMEAFLMSWIYETFLSERAMLNIKRAGVLFNVKVG